MRMDIVSTNSENLLSSFPPILRQNFKELFLHGKIGLTPIALNDVRPSKYYVRNNQSYGYSYTIKVPYASKRLNWELIFCPEDLKFAPDFNFNDETFYLAYDINSIIENVPSLEQWNVYDAKSLITVLKQFLSLYKKQQLERLSDNIYAHVNLEYQSLVREVNPHDVEIYLEHTCAHFLISVKVDVSALPEYLQPIMNGQNDDYLNPGDDTCYLKVSFVKLDGSRVNTSLQLSPRIDQLINRKTFHFPDFVKHSSLPEYVTTVTNLLQEHIEQLVIYHKLKKEFMTCLCTMYAESVLEFDSEKFDKAEILLEVDDYHCLVQIEINQTFPEEKPTVTLIAINCHPLANTCREKLDYEYNPHWTPEEMLAKLMDSLGENIQRFENHKHA
ncbi:BRISC and BRCA1-A complex member 2 [Tribolium castaneum]|uniref:BRISC and BRCA1-A complex member 2 n=1 Tax=Tribolium castaneum TaxID=7070 RepID=D6X0Y3_TRICA|nr:PREDICTED: BRCA1-A complex subunit BRE [Tribolium castaneum]XP_015839311.1 PREDICTED: BRCA1-A complex subunit BRE [Tribolium castaneum]EFA10575.1 BRCA1-A complex subunit BRE-like Protein [Tribolium castaneum]|eukprot:XP_008198471.1 PREDICTED: BRCA1-A complex subunit BRE [Tribolium castaneum]